MGSGNWNVAASWGGILPAASDDVIIAGAVTLNLNTPLLASVTINAGGSLTMNLNRILSITGALIINSGIGATPRGSLIKITNGGGITAGSINNSGTLVVVGRLTNNIILEH